MAKTLLAALIVASATCFVLALSQTGAARVIREDGRVFIVDQRGERWDVTQAESLGFRADRFQYGIGRDGIRPLDDSGLRDKASHVSDRLRVIGIGEDQDARAYSVRTLTRHEIVNAELGDQPVAVGY